MSENVLILGATSAIARACGEALARRGDNVILAGRDLDEIEKNAADLYVRFGITAISMPFDALDFKSHESFFENCAASFDHGLNGVILAHGTMSDQREAEKDFAAARQMIETNYLSAVSILSLAANYFQERKNGFICGISSVAGDRGRQSNYIYGSSKAALTTYLSGLRNRLAPHGVSVLTVKPGFVDTSITFGLPGLFLVASPQKVADDIVRAIEKRKTEIYTPWFWWGIMTIIESIPERIFKKMKL